MNDLKKKSNYYVLPHCNNLSPLPNIVTIVDVPMSKISGFGIFFIIELFLHDFKKNIKLQVVST